MTELMPEQAVGLEELSGGQSCPPVGLDAVDEQLIARLAGRARAGGLQLTGEGGGLAQLTKRLVESALEGEITDTWAMTVMTRPGGTGATPVTGTGPRRC